MKIGKWLREASLAASMLLISGGLALAATVSGNLPVSASVSNNCAFGTINALNFGAYDPVVANASTDLTGTGTFALTCTSGGSITIGLSLGGHAVSTQRNMADAGTDKLSYNLYQDSTDTTVWDETTTKSDTGTGSAVTYTVYGVVPHGQNVPAGSYSDTVSIDVTY